MPNTLKSSPGIREDTGTLPNAECQIPEPPELHTLAHGPDVHVWVQMQRTRLFCSLRQARQGHFLSAVRKCRCSLKICFLSGHKLKLQFDLKGLFQHKGFYDFCPKSGLSASSFKQDLHRKNMLLREQCRC